MLFRQLFDRETCTYTYLVANLQTQNAILVDPVLEQVGRDLQLLKEIGLTLRSCLETHLHADHVTGSGLLRELTGCQIVVPEGIRISCANLSLEPGEILQMGEVTVEAIATPGHTDSHFAYLINKTHLLTGDSLLIRGCGRTDLQSGNAGHLYDAVTHQLFTLPEDTWVYPGHDYRGQTVSTIGEEKRHNPRFEGRDRNSFIELMQSLNLPLPKNFSLTVPANQQCGQGPLLSGQGPLVNGTS